MDAHAAEVVVIVLAQIVAVAVYAVTTRERLNFMAKRLDRHDESHKEHYAHSTTTALALQQIASDLSHLSTLSATHFSDDLRMHAQFGADLREVQKGLVETRELVTLKRSIL